MKKNILSVLFFIVLGVCISVFGYSTYQYYRAIHADDPIDPYLLVDMGVGERYNLQEKDILITSRDG